MVASTTRRRPCGSGCSTLLCCSTGNSPCSGRTSTPLPSPPGRRWRAAPDEGTPDEGTPEAVPAGVEPDAAPAGATPAAPPPTPAASSAACTRPISRCPGRNTSTSPGCCCSACSTARRVCASSDSSRRAGKCAISTGKLRPALDSRGASRNCARRSPSSVADITTMRRSSRTCACTSRASARPKSAARWRSWNSSNSSAPTPSSIGSSCSMRVRMPSVTTSMRVRADTLFSKRMR
ncbi:hypothetical protein NB705_000729 [Xanthomonas sacchari]|nr:hypothetical protein [Xanthomonas sacchari]